MVYRPWEWTWIICTWQECECERSQPLQVLSPHRELFGAISSDSQGGFLHLFVFYLIQELREIHNKQQLQKQKSLEAERLKQKEQERKTVELEKQKEAQR